MELKDAIELAFIDLEETYVCNWRSGKGSRESLIRAFSQRDIPAYKYLGYEGSDGLRHVFGRSIPDNNKPANMKWEDWILKRIGLYYCSECNVVHEDNYICNLARNTIANNRSLVRDEVSEYICNYLLNNPCVICSEKDILVLEFDHIDPSTKSFDIGNRSNRTLKTVKEEISKCRVLCSNCHKRHTAKTQNHYKWLFTKKLNEKDI